MKKLDQKLKNTHQALEFFKNTNLTPEEVNPVLEKNKSSTIKQKTRAGKILSRPQIKIGDLKEIQKIQKISQEISKEGLEQAEIQIKYNGYIDRENETVKKLSKLEGIKIPQEFNYNKLAAISSESREKLSNIQPATIGQASRISGVSPSDINVLLIFMGR